MCYLSVRWYITEIKGKSVLTVILQNVIIFNASFHIFFAHSKVHACQKCLKAKTFYIMDLTKQLLSPLK